MVITAFDTFSACLRHRLGVKSVGILVAVLFFSGGVQTLGYAPPEHQLITWVVKFTSVGRYPFVTDLWVGVVNGLGWV